MTVENAAKLATTVLGINANAKYPGTIDPSNAGYFLAALSEARDAAGLGEAEGVPLVEDLLHVMWMLADFAAGRDAETTEALVQAFAASLAQGFGDGQ